jgi:pilus assembly protein FimV
MKKNNLRYLTTTFAAATLLASSSSYALGIGEMKLQSALNQNLRAEIGLILSDGEIANDFKVNLAPDAKFDEAGIPWTLFLSKIKFKIVSKNDKTIIELSSTEVLKEPFLDFLIEVRGVKGSLYREFTVLIDPPSVYQNEHIVTPISEPQHFVTAPTNPTALASGNYGPTRENDTLWTIATQFNKQNNVSIHRMLAAILIANPDAFQSDKAHTMIVGKMLKIPTFVESPELFIVGKKQKISPTIVKQVIPAREKKSKTTNSLANEEPNIVTSAKKSVEKKTSEDAQQRLAELEKKLATMQKTIDDKELEMATLKAAGKSMPVVVAPPVIPVKPAPVVVTPPVIPITSTAPLAPVVSVIQPIAVMPPPALPIAPLVSDPIITPVAPVIATPAASTAAVADNYFGIPSDLYYYVAGGVGSLLLGVLGFLRLREQKKAKESVVAEITPIVEETKAVESTEIVTDIIVPTDVTNSMFDDTFDMDHSMFDDAAAEFADMVSNDSDKHGIDDILYKVDVYCTYGNNEQAIKLLHDEFFKNPEAHDYALRLLKLYQTQENKAEFKDFVFELVKLGKKDLPDFWSKVSDISAAFYPEALFFMPPPAIPDSNAILTNEMLTKVNVNVKFEDDLDFDSMTFDDADDKEITFGELTVEETLTSGTANDIFAKSLDDTALDFGFDTLTKKEPSVNLGGFTLGDSLDAELEFNFDNFAVEKTLEPEIIEESALNLDFGNFAVAEVSATEAMVFELPKAEEAALDLDFGNFAGTEMLATEAIAFELPKAEEAALDLDFSSFAVEEVSATEAIAFELPKTEETALDLDFGNFAGTDVSATEALAFEFPKAEDAALDLDFGSFSVAEAMAFELPKAEETALDLDFGSFAVADVSATEALAFELPKAEEAALNFSNFAVEEVSTTEALAFELPKAEEAALNLDFGSFAGTEALAFELPKAEEAALDFGIQNFTFNESEKIMAVDMPKTIESRIVKPEPIKNVFAEPEAVTTKKPLSFNSANDLLEERVNQTHLELAKIHAEADVQIEYLDMSDSQFADSLASEVLKKCQMKEQLCRQKIIQDVLSKLS